MRLMLLRHAKTERGQPGESDRERRLTPRGRADAPVVGAYMTRHGLVPDLALISPAVRALETWKLVAACLATAPRAVSEERIYNASAGALIALVAATRGPRSLLLVGHNPGIHDLAMLLIGAGEAQARQQLTEKLPTAGLVVIDLAFEDWSRLHPGSGRLVRFASPRLIAAAAE